jgi:hypothetical protein
VGEFRAKWTGLEAFLGICFLKGGSEKGCSREHTGKRVASWRIMFWRNLKNSC